MIRTIGNARFTDSGRDVLAFHLHRYLAHWLAKSDVARVFVTVGWEHTTLHGITIEVGRQQSSTSDVDWTFAELREAYHRSGDQVPVGDEQLRAMAVREPDTAGVPRLLGFVVVDRAVDATLLSELEIHTGEAIRAARRNGVRLFFDECDDADVKALLYDVLDRLGEWVGCDVAAACVLANSLEAMTIERAAEADFYVMAERLFCDDENATRLVGLSIDTRDEIRTVVDASIEHLADDPNAGVSRFVSQDDGYVDESGGRAVSIGTVTGRPSDGFSVVAPIVAERHDERELVGLVCVAFSGTASLPASAHKLLVQLGEELGRVLRHSPLYTLSASRLRLVREVRRICEHNVASDDDVQVRRDRIVSEVCDLVEQGTGVPAFSVGYVVGAPRKLRYTSSFGWTDFDTIDLLVDVDDDDHADSGVSALAVRLNRSIVLAGGRRNGDHPEFKNFLWVHEGSGQIVDVRAPGVAVQDEEGWSRLGEYYKPAREAAYATIAHPVSFDGRALGVVALEVDRDTEWTWWAGYGAQLLWELVGSELSFAFWVLDRELNG